MICGQFLKYNAQINGTALADKASEHKGLVWLSAVGKSKLVFTLCFLSHPKVSCAKTIFNTEEKLDILKLVLSPIAEAETIEGLFDVLVALGASSGGDAEDFAVGDVVFQLPLAEDHGAFGLLGARQQDVGGVASTLQQSG